MDTLSSSNEDSSSVTKARKPYTITKQRERWTGDEHSRFLEAIKLYGRAWHKIQEHIATKTAVQIRSHAQKFFSKLEKESLIKGVPIGQARDIDIPPPRPKRKPNNPYPRKTSLSTPPSVTVGVKDVNLSTTASSYSSKQIQDRENKQHHETPCKRTRTIEGIDKDNISGTVALSQETPCESTAAFGKSTAAFSELQNQCVFRDFIPLVKGTQNEGLSGEFHLGIDPDGKQKLDKTDASRTDLDNGISGDRNLNNCCKNLGVELIEGEKLKQQKNFVLPKGEIGYNQNCPKHIPKHALESSSETCIQSPSQSMTHPASIHHQVQGTFRSVKNLTSPTASTTTETHSNISIQQSLPNIPSLPNPLSNNQDSRNMFVSSTFPNLIVSSLLQNPPALAAASFAASLWPFTSVENAVDSPLSTTEGFQLRHAGSSPSISAIASATVMAATAWWAAHGMLPLLPPLHPSCIPTPTNPTLTDASLVLVEKEKDHKYKAPPAEGQQLDTEIAKAIELKLPDSKSPPLLLSDNDKNGNARSNIPGVEVLVHEQKPLCKLESHGSDKGNPKELVDRSSCGSNTPSSSEVETDMLEKCPNGNDGSKELNVNHWTNEPNNQRLRGASNMTDAWKEVSQEGKLAFKALFSREVLPQSFSPPKCLGNNERLKSNEVGIHEADGNAEDKAQLDLNSKSLSSSLDFGKAEICELMTRDITEKGLLTMGCGCGCGCECGKLKACRTGFKPYKRCSLEAKESTSVNGNNKDEERDPKRVCLEEASI